MSERVFAFALSVSPCVSLSLYLSLICVRESVCVSVLVCRLVGAAWWSSSVLRRRRVWIKAVGRAERA